jgi:predicted nucleic acid-binding protein
VIVVSDTSCVTNLLAIGRAELLRGLFGEVVIPSAVARELRVAHAALPDFIREQSVKDSSRAHALAIEPLDEGEAEAIVLAEELHADYLLMDEAAGRAVALRCGQRVIGLLGLLVRAKQQGLIPAVAPLLDALERDAGFWMTADLKRRVLEQAGE